MGQPDFLIQAPSGPPPATGVPSGAALAPNSDAPPKKKKKTGVDGLASSKKISSGGSVTIYSGYSSISSAQQGQKSAAADPAQALINQQAQAQKGPNPGASVSGREGLERQLPEGWEMKRSRTTGRIYYVNEKLGTSQFDPPHGSTVKAEARKEKVVKKVKDGPTATHTDKNGVMGAIRASTARTGRWAKWNRCNDIIHKEDEEEADD